MVYTSTGWIFNCKQFKFDQINYVHVTNNESNSRNNNSQNRHTNSVHNIVNKCSMNITVAK